LATPIERVFVRRKRKRGGNGSQVKMDSETKVVKTQPPLDASARNRASQRVTKAKTDEIRYPLNNAICTKNDGDGEPPRKNRQ